MLDHVAHRADLDDAAGIHHGDAVGGLGDHAHVVGDQHHRRAVLAAQPLQQRDDLRLDRDVERRGRLVGDDQLRARRTARARSRRAGACRRRTGAGSGRCAARRPGCRPPRRSSMARLRACGRLERQVGLDRLDQLAADRVERVQLVSGSWKIAPIARRGAGASPRSGRLSMRRPFEADLAAGDAAGRLQQADDRPRRSATCRRRTRRPRRAPRPARCRTRRRRARAACRGASGTRRGGCGLRERDAPSRASIISAASGSARRAASRPAGSPPAPAAPARRRERR